MLFYIDFVQNQLVIFLINYSQNRILGRNDGSRPSNYLGRIILVNSKRQLTECLPRAPIRLRLHQIVFYFVLNISDL